MEQAGMAPGSAVPFVIPDARQRDPESSATALRVCHKPWISAVAAMANRARRQIRQEHSLTAACRVTSAGSVARAVSGLLEPARINP